MKNNNEKCLTEQVEYAIYNQYREKIDLSICKEVNIKIEYSITNSSLLNIEKILKFKNKGIDILKLKDAFFSDICYPYSDDKTNSDMILNDRVSDIYQNFSLCDIGCEYESFDIVNMKSNCICKTKQYMSPEISKGNFQTYIKSSFLNSNFGVIKCYNLVFGIKGKLNNIGFWLFGAMIIFHFPLYVIYSINGINPIKNYINNEMNDNGYIIENKNSLNSEIQVSSNETILKEDNKEIPCKKQRRKSKFYKKKIKTSS